MNKRSALAVAVLLPFSALGCAAEGSPSSTAGKDPGITAGKDSAAQAEVAPGPTVLPTEPADVGYGREPQHFGSLASMVRAADLVVVGEVVSVVPGRAVEGFRYRVDEVRVTRYIKGQPAASNLLVEELGWLNDEPWTLNDAAWASVGDKAVMALVNKEGESWNGEMVYRLASTQSRFFFDSTGTLRSNYLKDAANDPFVDAQLAQGRDALVADLEAVVP